DVSRPAAAAADTGREIQANVDTERTPGGGPADPFANATPLMTPTAPPPEVGDGSATADADPDEMAAVPRSSRAKWVVLASVAALLLVGGGVGLIVAMS